MSQDSTTSRSQRHEAATVVSALPARGIPEDHRPASRRLGKVLREHRPTRAPYQVKPSRAHGVGRRDKKGAAVGPNTTREMRWQDFRLFAGLDLTQELRLLCRDEVHLIEQRTAWVNQLRQALHEYYPAALEAFDDWICPAAWSFVKRFPTPAVLAKAGRRNWEKFLHVHRLARPETYQPRLEIFARAGTFCGSPAVTSAKSRLALVLAEQLQVLEKQLHEYRQAIDALFQRHPDHDVFNSLPGAGAKLAPRLLSELGSDHDRFQDAQGLQSYVGTAPVCFQSGSSRRVKLRRACNKWPRTAVHLWANQSRFKCAWASVYYQKKRQEGKSHATALRCLGQRWLKIILRMWQGRCPYDEGLHLQSMIRRGTWALQLPAQTWPVENHEPPVGNIRTMTLADPENIFGAEGPHSRPPGSRIIGHSHAAVCAAMCRRLRA